MFIWFSQNVLVYCSETTRTILLCHLKYKHLEDYVVSFKVQVIVKMYHFHVIIFKIINYFVPFS